MNRALTIAGLVLSAASLGYIVARDSKAKAKDQKTQSDKAGKIEHRGVTVDLFPLPTKDYWKWEVVAVSDTSRYPHRAAQWSGGSPAYETAVADAQEHIDSAINLHGKNHPLPPKPSPDSPYDSYGRGPFTVDLFRLPTSVRWRVLIDDAVVSSGIQPSDSDARVAANAFVDALPPPDSMGGATEYGLRVSPNCDTITVDDESRWIAWSSPRLLSTPGDDTREVVLSLLEEAFPDCVWPPLEEIRVGRVSLANRIRLIDSRYQLPAYREGRPMAQPTEQPSALEKAAAALVGVTAPGHNRRRFAYRGHILRTTPESGGNWLWEVQHPEYIGALQTGTEPNSASAVATARKVVDALLEELNIVKVTAGDLQAQ